MNDLDTVRSLRAHFAPDDATRLAPGRARLLTAIDQRPRPPRTGRVILSAAAAVIVAAGAAVAISGGESASHGGLPVRHATLTAQLLERASATVARRHVRTPGPRQWFYISYVDYSNGQHPAITRDPEWNTFDGHSSAYYGNGRLIVHQSRGDGGTGGPTALDKFNANATPQTAYDALASLPASPRALLAIIDRQAAKMGPNGPGSFLQSSTPTSSSELDFDYLAGLLWNAVDGAPPAIVSAVFQAMADIPGVTSRPDSTDLAGRPAVGLSADGGFDQLLLDPKTYQVVGMQQVSTGSSAPRAMTGGGGGAGPARGSLISAIAIAQLTAVSRPGAR